MKKDKKRERCPICGKYEFPTKDHVPPKSCNNFDKKIIHYFISDKNGGSIQKETQNGVHYEHICSSCNNGLLGGDFDLEFKKFYEFVLNSDDVNIKWRGDISKIIKCIFGHILATTKYSNCIYDKQMRNYILNDIIPSTLTLFLFYYPYDAIFTIKNAFPIVCFKIPGRKNYNCPDETILDSLYFKPFAFIVAEKGSFSQGVDLLNLVQNGISEIELNKNTWIDLLWGIYLPPCWPCMISENKSRNTVDAVICGADLESFNISTKKY